MTKAKDTPSNPKAAKDKEPKGKSNLVGRVKKVIKKSRRKLGEEKFEKELQRTIEFLAQLQMKLNHHAEREESGKAPVKIAKKPVKKVEKKAARTEAKKAKPNKKKLNKPAVKSRNKKGKSAAPKVRVESPALEPVVALQPEALAASQQTGEQ